MVPGVGGYLPQICPLLRACPCPTFCRIFLCMWSGGVGEHGGGLERGVGDLGDGELLVVGGDGDGIEVEGRELVISVTDSCS